MTEALRKKYESIRNGRNEYERKLEETFRPITNPLKEVVTNQIDLNDRLLSTNQSKDFLTPISSKKLGKKKSNNREEEKEDMTEDEEEEKKSLNVLYTFE